MMLSALDNPLVLSTLFYPRPDQPGSSTLADVHDGTIPVGDNVMLGYRLYASQPDRPVIVYFHGNGEIASDHDMFANDYRALDISLLVIDFRGYGWSTGKPTVSALLGDVDPIMEALPGVLQKAGLAGDTLLVMGRSLGSAPAIHAAHTAPDRFKGIIIESGFSRATRLLARLGLPQIVTEKLPDPVGNDRKLSELTLPLLIIHGERDTLLPVTHGQELYDASPAENKRIVRIPRAGHNDLMFVDLDGYFDAIKTFIHSLIT